MPSLSSLPATGTISLAVKDALSGGEFVRGVNEGYLFFGKLKHGSDAVLEHVRHVDDVETQVPRSEVLEVHRFDLDPELLAQERSHVRLRLETEQVRAVTIELGGVLPPSNADFQNS